MAGTSEPKQPEPRMAKKFLSESQKLRSRAYPAISLAESIELLRKLTAELGRGERDRDTIAKALGYSGGNSGIAGRKVAALVHFGLMELQGGFYSPTDLARKILDEISIPRNLLREAFLCPTLFREIVNRYESAGRVPRQLVLTLSLDHGIQEHAREEAAQIFMESATYAGVLESDGFFRKSYLEDSPKALPLSLQSDPTVAAQSPGDGAAVATTGATRVLQFQVTDGKEVMFHLPSRLNEQDISLLRLQIDFLESQMRQDRLDQPLRFDFHRGDRNR